MKPIGEMSLEELAAYVSETLARSGITVTLTGGACVAIWSTGAYISNDLDFIEEGPVPRAQIQKAMESIGFKPKGRYFVHVDTKLFVEFPTGPLMIGDERVERVAERETEVGKLRLLSPTDCVKDRLAAFFHWNDQQSLEQALLVAQAKSINVNEVRRWSEAEGHGQRFATFEERLLTSQKKRKSRRRRRPKG